MNDTEIYDFLMDPDNVRDLFPSEVAISHLLNQGGQGIVYKGEVSGRAAAIKVYFPGQLVQRFEREIKALLSLNNPNIVKILWTGTMSIGDVVLPSIATEYIDGATLAERIRNAKFSHDQIGVVAYDIANAINAMWLSRDRIVHRDLKPTNIIMMLNERACVIDLGVARHINRTPLTTVGSTWGTSGYMSPEQEKAAKQITCKSDIFALGIILVECAMGRHPSRNDQDSLRSMKLHDNLPFEISNWEHVELLKKMLHPSVTKRPLPQEILQELKTFAPN